ncbi:Selenocysteine-specific elongation factor [Phytophthora fragariae]|uniref:Elongation factor Tu, chloroplastic n=1 Tax=Phytophthora fragariae TaxID=53985 RepID=A0A6G0R646_9STRA|nr:Selenocysteine-specific elongation factor [Phytophthora fragariae]
MLLNVNVGVLGHVDSGKTSLVRALSTQLSTPALDKHPQSQQRGITLDLGFSSFVLMGTHPSLQVTLVDCPGHASLFRTILGGVAIIDAVLLVVDCRKGLQPQTIESLLLAALAAKKRVVVALTKTDLLSCVNSEKMATIDAVAAETRVFLATYLQVEVEAVPVVPVAVGVDQEPQGIQELLEALRTNLQPPDRDTSGDFRLAVDHCFAVPGNGTVLTGTVLSGALKRGDELELLPIGVKTKVKTLQVFKREVDRCAQGDRVGVRVNGLDPTLVERALAVSPPGSLAPVTQVVIPVTRVSFFQGAACKSGGKCHATVGHTTVIATTTFFSRLGAATEERGGEGAGFDPSALYEYVAELDFGDKGQGDGGSKASVFALLQFEHAVFCPPNALVVCSRLDLDAKRFPCRLAFYGAVTSVVGSNSEELSALAAVHRSVVELTQLQIGRVKSREGFVDKVVAPRSGNIGDAREVIGRDMFSKDVKWSVYQDTVVLFEQARVLGTILGPFGKAGKFRIALEASTLHRSLPVPGEKFVLRFLKLMTLKPPTLKGKSVTLKTAAFNAKPKVITKDNGRPFLQDKDLLYPEAFTPLSTTAVKEEDVETVTIETANLSTVEVPARAHEGATTEPTTAPRSGRIERLKGETAADGRNPFAIVVGMFTSEQEAEEAVGCRVRFVHKDGVNTDFGTIEKPFGKAGKIRVEFRGGGTMGQVGDSVERC